MSDQRNRSALPLPGGQTAEQFMADIDSLDALRLIAKEGECSISMAGPCVGALQNRRTRWDNPERVWRIGCAKHFAVEYLAVHGADE